MIPPCFAGTFRGERASFGKSTYRLTAIRGVMEQDYIRQGMERSGPYWVLLISLLPLFVVGATVGVVRYMGRSYYERNWRQRAGALFVAAMVSGTAGCVAALVAGQMPDVTPEMTLLAGFVGGGMGQKLFDMLIRRMQGLSVVNFRKPDELKSMMTPEQQDEHVRLCPWRNDKCPETNCKNGVCANSREGCNDNGNI